MTHGPLAASVSVFQGSTNTTPVEAVALATILQRIQDGTYQQHVEALRGKLAMGDTALYNHDKKRSVGFTPAGLFTRRANAGLVEASGLVHFDFDHLAHLPDAKARLTADPWIAYAFVSPSGDGLKVAVWTGSILNDATYKHAWRVVLGYFQQTYPDLAVANDRACKDIARMCYASWDPDLYMNPTARLYALPPDQAPAVKPLPGPRSPAQASPQPTSAGEYPRVEAALQVIPAEAYDTWLCVGMALHSSGEPWARGLWDTWSARSEKYDAAKQDTTWASFSRDGAVTLGSLFHLAQERGYAPSTPAAPPILPVHGPSPNGQGPGNGPGGPPAGAGTTTEAYQGPLPYSDYTNAVALTDAYGHLIRFCEPWNTWLEWTGTHWLRDQTGVVHRYAVETVKAMLTTVPTLDKDGVVRLLQHVKNSLSNPRINSMLSMASKIQGISILPAQMDSHPWLLNCTNGTLDLRTGDLKTHDPAHLLTRCLDIPYEKDATCPEWEKFLWRIMGGTDRTKDSEDDSALLLEQRDLADTKARKMIAFLQRAIGYSLTGSTREQCLFIVHGITKTGKSTFLAVLRKLLGPYGTQADMETFMYKDRQQVRNDLADLAGKRLVCAVEAQEGRRLNENLIKQLTGGVDEIKARFLFEEFFTFAPQFKLFLGTNHKPVIRDTDDAIWERIRLISFKVQIPVGERVKDLDETLLHELPGILAWAVKGCLAWQAAKDLKAPEQVTDATQHWKAESDVMESFLKDVCIVEPAEKTLAGRLRTAYQEWSGQTTVSGRRLAKLLTDKGYHSKHERGGTFWYGLGLPEEPEEEETTETKPAQKQSQQALPGV